MSVPDKGNIKVFKDEFLDCRLLLTCLLTAGMTIFALKLGLTVQAIFFFDVFSLFFCIRQSYKTYCIVVDKF